AISVSGPPVITKRITMGLMEADELYDQIHHDAGQYIPFDLADVSLDYQVLGTTPMGDQQEVLLVAVKKAKIADYQRTLSLVPGRKLGLAVVDVDAFAIQNAFEANYDPSPDATLALLNIGASVTNINIVRGGVPLFIRDVAVGGNQYTDALQKDFELTWEQAEEAKRGQPVPGVNTEQMMAALRGTSETLLLLEIQKTFDFFRATAGAEPISQIYVAGGAVRTPGLLDLLREEFQMQVEELNPFNRINYNPGKFSDDFIRERAPRLAVSVGLALRSFDEA
ncbi:MAG: type IV pilus assembly protein PilM, partial [Candidatus Acidiferrales bacterium]